MTDVEFLTVAEVAALLKMNEQTIRNWIIAEKLPIVRRGRRVLIPRSEFESLFGPIPSKVTDPDLLTVTEVSELLRVSEQTVRNWMDANKLPQVRAGRRVRIRRADLERFMLKGANPRPKDPQTADDFWSGVAVGEAVLPQDESTS